MEKEDYTNSKIECPVCRKKLAKNYMGTHIKTIHKNAYGSEWWEKYAKRLEKIKEDNRKLYLG